MMWPIVSIAVVEGLKALVAVFVGQSERIADSDVGIRIGNFTRLLFVTWAIYEALA